jgi:sugar/nucleoside kinase (ribokinase family)
MSVDRRIGAGGAADSVIRRLVSVGNVVVDLVAQVPQLPARGGDVLASNPGLAVGGGFNVLVASVRQGLPAAYGGTHGTGPFGDLARSALRDAGIGILLEPVADCDTGYDVALTDAGGERTFITAPGAEGCLTAERIAHIELNGRDAVYVSGYSLVRSPNRETIVGWLQTLPESVTVVVDPGPLIADIPADVYEVVRARATWWSCNLREATLATGFAAATDAIRALADQTGAGGVTVRLGA